jgi:DNA ligase-associated metallophosphoesterase
MMEVEAAGQRLRLLAQGGVYWCDTKTLMVADLHLGKEAAFQQAGLAIPHGSTPRTLQALEAMLRACEARRVVILGDLLHHPTGFTLPLQAALMAMLRNFTSVEWLLVRGNHDRRIDSLLNQLAFSILEPPTSEPPLVWLHDPAQADPKQVDQLFLAGHLHPNIAVELAPHDRQRFRCFWWKGNVLILPALGVFTGARSIRRQTSDRVIACVDNQLIEIPPPPSPRKQR